MQHLKNISLGLMNWMIIFTFLMSPLTSNFQVVYAAGESKKEKDKNKNKKDDDCKEEENKNEDGKPGVYKPGCKFDDALADINENPGGKGIKGMVEQFVGIAFASAAVSSLIFKHTPRSLDDCPQNKNANITLRLMQAGALAYLLGEMKAKAEFNKASKLATDVTFTPKEKLAEDAGDDAINERNKEENNKQLEAYETLIKIYEHKVKGINTKKNLAMVAEVAYLGALGTELVMTMGHKGVCKASMAKYQTARTTILTELEALKNPVCLAPIEAFLLTKNANIAKKEGQASSQLVTAEIQSIADNATTGATLAAAGASISGGETAAVAPVETSAALTEYALEVKRETAIETSRQALMGLEQAAWSTASSACLPAAAIQAQDIANESTPLLCCGADVASPTNGYAPVPLKSVMDKKRDILIKKIPIIGTNQIEFIKPAILNTIEQFYFAKLMQEHDYKRPEKTVAKLKSFYGYLSQLEENFDHEIQHSEEFKLYKKELAGEFDEEKNHAAFEKIKLSLIQDAHAVNFMSILGFGAKLFAMNKLLGSFLRNKGLTKPKNRMYTFGAMGAVNAAIVFFEGKKLSENKEYLEIVKAEKERFEKSHGMLTGMVAKKLHNKSGEAEGMIRVGEGEGTEYLRLTKNKGLMACATPAAGKSFAPAPCPQKLPDTFLKELKTKNANGGGAQVTPLLQQIPGLVATTTAGAASGDDLNNPEVFGGNLTALENKRSALRAQVDELVKDYDETNKPSKNDKSKVGEPLARTLANIQETFKGTPIGGGASVPTLGNLSDSTGVQEVEEATTKKDPIAPNAGQIAAVPNYQTPSYGGGSSEFDFGDSESSNQDSATTESGAQSLDEFVVNTGDVADKPEANLFQLISNRYLRSYPVLLDEVDPKEPAD